MSSSSHALPPTNPTFTFVTPTSSFIAVHTFDPSLLSSMASEATSSGAVISSPKSTSRTDESSKSSVQHTLATRPHACLTMTSSYSSTEGPLRPSSATTRPREAKCTTTLYINTPFTLGPTSTQYAATTESASEVPCGRCALRVINRGGLGPVVHFTTTATVQETKTVDVFQCSSLLESN